MFDFTHDDKEDLVVGRDDGTIEAITFDEEMPKVSTPALWSQVSISMLAAALLGQRERVRHDSSCRAHHGSWQG